MSTKKRPTHQLCSLMARPCCSHGAFFAHSWAVCEAAVAVSLLTVGGVVRGFCCRPRLCGGPHTRTAAPGEQQALQQWSRHFTERLILDYAVSATIKLRDGISRMQAHSREHRQKTALMGVWCTRVAEGASQLFSSRLGSCHRVLVLALVSTGVCRARPALLVLCRHSCHDFC